MLRFIALALLACMISAGLQAQSRPQLNDGEPHGDPPFLLEDGWEALLNGRGLSGWHGVSEPGAAPKGGEDKYGGWVTTAGVLWERLLGPAQLRAVPQPGDRIVNGNGRVSNLVSDQKHGDIELYLEFMLAKGSNSGVYLQGLYEVQVFDSWGSEFPMKTSDGGGIYHRWLDNQALGGSAPKLNASRRPGEWQSFQIWFRAPRFDAGGKKTENAKFVRVLHNGLLVQQEVDLDGGTRAHMAIEEAPLNPLMLQGDHGPVAYRYIHWRPLRPIVGR